MNYLLKLKGFITSYSCNHQFVVSTNYFMMIFRIFIKLWRTFRHWWIFKGESSIIHFKDSLRFMNLNRSYPSLLKPLKNANHTFAFDTCWPKAFSNSRFPQATKGDVQYCSQTHTHTAWAQALDIWLGLSCARFFVGISVSRWEMRHRTTRLVVPITFPPPCVLIHWLIRWRPSGPCRLPLSHAPLLRVLGATHFAQYVEIPDARHTSGASRGCVISSAKLLIERAH